MGLVWGLMPRRLDFVAPVSFSTRQLEGSSNFPLISKMAMGLGSLHGLAWESGLVLGKQVAHPGRVMMAHGYEGKWSMTSMDSLMGENKVVLEFAKHDLEIFGRGALRER